MKHALLALETQAGTLSEISGVAGAGKTETVVQELARLLAGAEEGARAAWVECGFSIYPPALEQRGIDLDQLVLIDAGPDPKRAVWAAQQAIQSQIFTAVVLAGVNHFESVPLRRLQLVAEKTRVTVLILSDFPTTEGSWPLRLQAQVARPASRLRGRGPERESPELQVQVQVLKRRGALTASSHPLHSLNQGKAHVCLKSLNQKLG